MRIHLALCGALLAAGCSAPQSRTVNLYFVPEPSVPEIVRNCNDSARGAYRIVHHELPRDGDGQHEQARHALRGNANLIGMDVTWTAEFADAGLIAPWQDANLEAAEDDVLAGPLKTTRWDGRTYAATKNSNVQLLWYDDRVISTPPSTWDQVIAEASRLRDAGRPHRVLVTGAEYEGLVVLYNSLVASAGGQILAPDGKTVVLDDGARLALEMLLTGDMISAQAAREAGLVNRVVPAAELEAAARALAEQILAASATVVGLGKQAFYRQLGMPQHQAYAYAKEVMSFNATFADAQEGMCAFLAKRPPQWGSNS